MPTRRGIAVAVGLILAVAGAVALAVGGIPYTEQEQIVDVGPLEASGEVEREFEVPPLVAGGVLAAGVGLTIYGVTRTG